MNEVVFVIGSVTYAMKAQRVLKGKGIGANLIKQDSTASRGCAYGIKIRAEYFITAVALLRENGIRYEVVRDDTT